ncbi:MAG: MBL fold metallo-hydrolase [Promethearchaeota archaeon]
MNTTMIKHQDLIPGIKIIKGAVNCGLIMHEDECILIDCCDSITPKLLKEKFGIKKIDGVYCTQYKRTHTAGLYHINNNITTIHVPENEVHLFNNVDKFWNDPKNRWHVYHSRPSLLVLPRPIAPVTPVHDNQSITWHEWNIKAISTPATSDGAFCYLINNTITNDNNATICFAGDIIAGKGCIWNIHALQNGFKMIQGYHGFLGAIPDMENSIRSIMKHEPEWLIPNHGKPINNVKEACRSLMENLKELQYNFISISALNHYFPKLYPKSQYQCERMPKARIEKLPIFIKRISPTSFIIISRSKCAMLIDCGNNEVIKRLKTMVKKNKIKKIDTCWITHYHDDHVDAIPKLQDEFKCKIFTEKHVATILENPNAFMLPCLSNVQIKNIVSLENNEQWQWHEFQMKAIHLPGQSLYHAGLIVKTPDNKNILFAGDSASPTGIDDYCPTNRNFTRSDAGYLKCINIWSEIKPDLLINQHQPRPFKFNETHYKFMKDTLLSRIKILEKLIPRDAPDFGIDPLWVRIYPYQQSAIKGATVKLDVIITNHSEYKQKAKAELVLPPRWTRKELRSKTIEVPPLTSGTHLKTSVDQTPDSQIQFEIEIPTNAENGIHVIPARITWNNQYLGQICHGIINVTPSNQN